MVALAAGYGGPGFCLEPLSHYTAATNNMLTTSIVTTPSGRVFMGVEDCHLYELLYHTGSGFLWGQCKCQKVRLVLLNRVHKATEQSDDA